MKKFLLLLLIGLAQLTYSQQIMIDRGVRAGGLWCFPVATDTLTYYYLPNDASLALDKKQNPEFSLIRYVITNSSSGNQANSIQLA